MILSRIFKRSNSLLNYIQIRFDKKKSVRGNLFLAVYITLYGVMLILKNYITNQILLSMTLYLDLMLGYRLSGFI